MSTRARGLLPDNGRYARPKFHDLKKTKLKAIPSGRADLSAFIPEILNQDGVGSCAACAIPCAEAVSLAARGTPLGFTPSVRDVYRLCLAEDRRLANLGVLPQNLPPLRDRGTMLMTVVHVTNKWGVRARGKNVKVLGVEYECDCSPDNATKEPTLDAVEVSSRRLVVGAYEIFPGPDVELDVKLSLDAGNAVALGGFVDSSHFDTYGPNSVPLSEQDLRDPYGGGHATYLTGYRYDQTLGMWVYEGVNSYGKGWGRLGRFECTGAFLRQMWGLYSMDVDLALDIDSTIDSAA